MALFIEKSAQLHPWATGTTTLVKSLDNPTKLVYMFVKFYLTTIEYRASTVCTINICIVPTLIFKL